MIHVNKLTDMPKEEVYAILEKSAEKLVNDEDFRKFFVQNPREALENLGLKFKKGVEVKFVGSQKEIDSLPDNVFPLLVPKTAASKNLSPEQLQQVAGGTFIDDAFQWGGKIAGGVLKHTVIDPAKNVYNGFVNGLK
ncbi:hypothetical protein [Legionella londiniensis]|uniref:Uncharacterized protein n=1 Tax=Legionella londiniensis TaxID=45068 RepID=A0A0W0VT51_9GAMM|nr:hypothetical protein [Legionella londiniensis]KTD23218.1 hypothetical protein Llon_0103 [Legionella londiniensis]STX93771.1 NHLP leader peptide domain [Legionella londiniensis]